MKKAIFLFLIGISGAICAASSHNSSSKKMLHVVIVVDTDLGGIDCAMGKDFKNIKKSVATIAEGIGFKLNTVVLSGKKCSCKNISQTLSRLNTSSNDIIIFYYSGNGYNTRSFHSRWPILITQRSRFTYGQSIIDCLRGKKKRNALILFDCCNVFGSKKCFILRREAKPFFLKKSHNLSGFFKLLLSSRGMFISCAASVEEFAGCTNEEGSFFTREFLKSIHHFGSSDRASWDAIFRLTVAKTAKIVEGFERSQHPIYEIERK